MRPLPESGNSLVIRTDYSDDKIWSSVRDQSPLPWEIFAPMWILSSTGTMTVLR